MSSPSRLQQPTVDRQRGVSLLRKNNGLRHVERYVVRGLVLKVARLIVRQRATGREDRSGDYIPI